MPQQRLRELTGIAGNPLHPLGDNEECGCRVARSPEELRMTRRTPGTGLDPRIAGPTGCVERRDDSCVRTPVSRDCIENPAPDAFLGEEIERSARDVSPR
jgi:hypothetical protein